MRFWQSAAPSGLFNQQLHTPLPATNHQVRKSFDARKAKPKMFAYVVDCDVAVGLESGALETEERSGLLEW